jgi:uncharacterized membrane protein YbhN (UPF0104 family)
VDRRRILSVLRLAVAAALIAVLARHVDLHGAMGILGRIDPLWLIPVAALVLTGTVLSSFRWRLALTRILGIDVPLSALIRLYFIGMFVNLGLPTTAGGDVVRAEMMRGLTGGRGGAYASILADRLIGAFAVVLLAGGAAVAAQGALDPGVRAFAGLALTAAILGVAVLAIGLRRFAGRGGRSRPSAFADALALIARRPGILAISLVIALAVQVVAVVLPVALLARATGIEVPLSVHFLLVPLIVLATLIPIAPNGLGLRETAFVILYARFGVPPESAVALGFAWSLTLTAFGLIGGLALATWSGGRAPATPHDLP